MKRSATTVIAHFEEPFSTWLKLKLKFRGSCTHIDNVEVTAAGERPEGGGVTTGS
jgi:hypothetical protein